MYIFVFYVVYGCITVATDNYKYYTAISFALGAFTSLFSGYIGMVDATQANVRVTFAAAIYVDEAQALKHALNTTFRGG